MARLRVAVVGLGFGKWLIENELERGPGAHFIELVGVCDLNAELTAHVAQRFGVRNFSSYEEVLADSEVDAVVLMTGPQGRGELVSTAVRARKPVMTTKPFDTSSEAALAALRLAQDAGVPVFMNSPSPKPEEDIKIIQDWVERFELGRPIAYRGATWCSYREKADGSWYDDHQLATAAPITRLGIYLIADVCRLFAPVDKVSVAESRIFTGRPTADNASILLTHSDGTLGSITASFCIDDGEPYKLSLEINFERGTVSRNLGPGVGEETTLELSTMVSGKKHIERAFVPRSSGYQWELFSLACKGEQIGETVTPEIIAEVVSVIEAIRNV
jgi:predicted dehydrogenase